MSCLIHTPTAVRVACVGRWWTWRLPAARLFASCGPSHTGTRRRERPHLNPADVLWQARLALPLSFSLAVHVNSCLIAVGRWRRLRNPVIATLSSCASRRLTTPASRPTTLRSTSSWRSRGRLRRRSKMAVGCSLGVAPHRTEGVLPARGAPENGGGVGWQW